MKNYFEGDKLYIRSCKFFSTTKEKTDQLGVGNDTFIIPALRGQMQGNQEFKTNFSYTEFKPAYATMRPRLKKEIKIIK